MKTSAISFILLIINVLLFQLAIVGQTTGSWVSTNGPYGGDVRCMTITSDGQVWAGTRNGGAFSSADNGEMWNYTGMAGFDVWALTCNADDDLFAGTLGDGVFRSTDGGGTWVMINNGLIYPWVISLAFSSTGWLFAGTVEGGGVYRSNDNGDTWILANNGLTNTYVTSLAVNPAGTVFAGTYDGVFRSTDNGDTWVQMNNGLTVPYILSLSIDADDDLFAGTDFGGGIFRSTDDGATWVQVNSGMTSTNGINALAAAGMSEMYAGTYGDGIFKSTDNGETWVQTSNGLTTPYIISLAVTGPEQLLAGAYLCGGIFRTTDGATTWEPAFDGLVAIDIRTVSETLYGPVAGSYGAGVFRLSGSGIWEPVNTGLEARYITSIAYNYNDGVLFAGADWIDGAGGIYRSDDYGATWTDVFSGISSYDVRALMISNTGDVFAGTYGDGIFRSTDSGNSWVQMNNGLTCSYVWSLGISTVPGELLAGTAGCGTGIYKSSDNGETWILSNTGLTTTDITALTAHGNGLIYAGTTNMFGPGGGIFRSEDGGSTWTESSGGLGSMDITSFGNETWSDVYAGTADGVYVTQDWETWTPCSEGLPSIRVQSLEFGISILYAGTAGSGVWSLYIPMAVPDSPDNTMLSLFPNPAEEVITLTHPSWKQGQKGTVEIYSADGRLLYRDTADENPVTLDISELTTGIYLVRWKDEEGVSVGKFVATRLIP